jgi:WD40 repeat protein/chitodextrinase
MRMIRYFRTPLFVFILCLSCFMLYISAHAQSDHRLSDHCLFVPDAWPKDTGAPVNSSPVLGDLDGDNILEIVVGSDNNKVYAWKPDGTLMPGWPVTTGDSVRSSPALADLDGDGRLDVIVGSFDNKVYAWNFNGSLLPGWPAVTGSVVYSSPAIGDIDGDQRPEVIVGSFDNKVYAWNADGTLVRGWPKPTGLFVYSSPALADIDKDGLAEVIVGTDNNRVFAWNGDGTDVEGWPTATEHVVPSSPAVGDIDNDGDLEIVVGSWDKVFVWNSQGEIKPGWPVTAGHQIPSSPALADLNHDGMLEIIVGCKDGKVYVWDAKGRLLPGWPTVTDAEISASPVVADLDGDGNLEVIIGSKDNKIYIWDAEGRLFPGWPKNTADAISSSPAIGDVDRDGTLELVVGSKDNKVYAWSFPRTGTFVPSVVWQNFHGDPSHTGLYGFQPGGAPVVIAYPTKPQQIIPAQPVPTNQASETRTVVQQPLIYRQPDQGLIAPREIIDGYVSDLLISDYDDMYVTLTWTAPPGIRTAQTLYEIRYSPQAITEETWNSATPYQPGISPAPAGTREVYKLTNLVPSGQRPPDTLYIALKVKDGEKSFPLSNVVRLERLDTIPPAKIQGLKVTDLDDKQVELSWQTTGDDDMFGTAATYDIRYSEVPLNELTWLRAIQIENEPAPLPAGTEQKFQIPKTWGDKEVFFGIKAIDKSLNISELSDVAVWSPGDKIPPARIVDLRVTGTSKDGITISWTAPGNNLNVGKVDHYDIRYADFPITEADWEKAIPLKNPPLPENAGTTQTYSMQDVLFNAVKFIGMKAVDSSNNASVLSNVVEVALDTMPPAPVTDLKVEEVGKDWVRLSWIAQGDDGKEGTASSYVLKYDQDLKVIKLWDAATQVQEVPVPSASGIAESATIKGLAEDTIYYVGLRILDDAGNSSDTSNIVRIKTLKPVTPPEAVTDLSIEDIKSGAVTLNWTAPSDVGEETPRVSGYDIRYAVSEITESNWETAQKVQTPPKPSEPGKLETFMVKGVPQDSTYYIALKSVDALGNSSNLSNVVHVPKFDKVAPAPILDLLVEDTGPDWAKINWTAPGNDKQEGQAASYLIRVAPNLQIVRQWDQAINIPTDSGPTPLSPSVAGTKENFTITGLKSKSTLYIAVKTVDDFGNVSEISNIVRAKTKDDIPPAAIADLQISDIQEDKIALKWTAPGDDGTAGRAQAYDIRYARERVTQANWGSAQIVPLVPRPATAGKTETVTVTGLQPSTLYYFAIIATDSSENASSLSNVVDALTKDNVPPPAITTLRAENVEENSVLVTWISPGNDEFRSAPERYEIRYRKGKENPLSEESWSQSTKVEEPPIPSPKGEQERVLLSGLQKNSFYSIGVKASDEYGNVADISNVVQVYTAADAVKDLEILDFSEQAVTLTWATPGGEISAGKRMYEIRYATTPITEENWTAATLARTSSPQALSLKEPSSTEKVEVTDLPPNEQLFFAVRVVRMGAEQQISELSNVVELNRIDILPPGEITNLQISDLGTENEMQSLQLTWTAPGDNNFEGTATKYDIRYGNVPATEENWDTLTPVIDAPSPLSAGAAQQTTVHIKPGEDTLYFAIKTYDEALNTSGLSNVAQWSPEDKTPPAAITDLTIERVSGGDITISWTAPGDNADRGTATFYDIRYATKEADVKKWDRAMVVAGEPVPEVAGTRQEYLLTELQQDTMYYIAMTTTDDARNTSALSNIVAIRTADAVPPAPIADLRVGKTGNDWAELLWTASGDDGNSGRATSYSLRYATDPDTLKNWDNAYELSSVSAPKDPGNQEEFTVKNLRSNTNYYFGIRAVDNTGNKAELSNVVETLTSDGESSEPINDLVSVGATETTLTLSWTAPRDRGPTPRIAQYDIRFAEDQERIEKWDRATKVKHTLVPGEPGTIESVVLEKLSPNQRYYVAIKAIDTKGNISEVSNIAIAYTTDTIPPEPITDLAAQATTESSVTLSWTVTKDDSLHDKPEVYDIRYNLEPIDETNWDQAEAVEPADMKVLQPSAPGIQMNYTVAGLAENTTYYFAVRSTDVGGNISPVSNVVTARTNDVTPPQAITDLQAIFPTSNSVVLSWASPSDTFTGPSAADRDLTGSSPGNEDLQISTYDIRYSTTPPNKDGYLDPQVWENAEKILAPPKPNLPGSVEEFVVSDLEPDKTYYFAIKALDQSGNISAISNTALETTLPLEFAQDRTPESGVRTIGSATGNYAWEVLQGKEKGEITKVNSGIFRIAQKAGIQETIPSSPILVRYPQSDRMLSVQQGELVFQVKSTQRFTLYVKVQAATGESYYLCYSTDFGIVGEQAAPDQTQSSTPALQTISVQRREKRIENYVFFPLESKVLDGEWHDVQVNLAQDLLEGTGQFYDATLRLSVRGYDVTLKDMIMQGAVFTTISDFEDRRNPLENGWKIHFGSGTVQVTKEPVLSKVEGAVLSKVEGAVLSKAEIVPRTTQENSFLFVKADSHQGIVLTYPQEGTGQLSNKPFFLADVKAVGEFKVILKVNTKDNREYYLVYLPDTEFQQTGSSGNYIYLPLHVDLSGGGNVPENWTFIQANIEQDLRDNQLDYAYTSWISFHGKEFSIDNVRFSTDILKTAIE